MGTAGAFEKTNLATLLTLIDSKYTPARFQTNKIRQMISKSNFLVGVRVEEYFTPSFLSFNFEGQAGRICEMSPNENLTNSKEG